MEIVRSERERKPSVSNGVISKLPIYRSAPSLEIGPEDFELYAIDRLRVLKGISDGLSRGKKHDEMSELVSDLWKANMRHTQQSEVVNKDLISHFALRLVYCRTEELRKWFLSMETALFRYRYQRETSDVQRAIVADLGLSYKPVSNAEFESVKDKLTQVASSFGKHVAAEGIFYKVPFEEVSELVGGRRVFVQKGNAYIAMHQLVSLVLNQFRSNMSKALVLTNRKWISTIREEEKDRFTPIVEALSTSYLGPDYSQPPEYADISLKDIDQVAKTSFPLCMRHLCEKLREDHHLKHGGRMQLGLFLKGVGLKLDDALAFWKAEFSRKVGAEKFDKEYAYSIRHNYGKEGKRVKFLIFRDPGRSSIHKCSDRQLILDPIVFYWNLDNTPENLNFAVSEDYTPYSCQKIISSTPGVGDHHGCPYRHFSDENLRAALVKMGVGNSVVEDVIGKARNRHYQLACTLTFEAIHGASCDAGISHPNQYYNDSKKIMESRNSSNP